MHLAQIGWFDPDLIPGIKCWNAYWNLRSVSAHLQFV